MLDVKSKNINLQKINSAIDIIREEFARKAVNVVKIILFGSRARGDARADSDWDLMILVDRELSSKEDCEISGAIYTRLALARSGNSYEIVVESERMFNEIKDLIGSLHYDVNKEGVLVWS